MISMDLFLQFSVGWAMEGKTSGV